MSTPAPTTAVVKQLGQVRIVPVTSFDDATQARATALALIRGGITCIEITFRTPVAAEAIAAVSDVDGLLVGAGTLLSPDQVRQAVRAGARFGVAPGTNPAVVEAAKAEGMPFFPGVATASEIERARTLEVEAVKVFPASVVGGTAFLNAVAAVYPDVHFIPTGGIDSRNLKEYADAPGVLAVGGSWIAPKALVRDARYDEIERLAAQARGLLA